MAEENQEIVSIVSIFQSQWIIYNSNRWRNSWRFAEKAWLQRDAKAKKKTSPVDKKVRIHMNCTTSNMYTKLKGLFKKGTEDKKCQMSMKEVLVANLKKALNELSAH